MKRLIIARRCSQVLFLFLFLYITVRPFNSFLPSNIFSAINPNLMIFLSLSRRMFFSGLAVSFIMIFLTLILGRFFCGWICPLGTFIDTISMIGKRKRAFKETQTGRMRYLKFFVLGAIFISALNRGGMIWFFDPLIIMNRFILFLQGKISDFPGITVTFVFFLLVCMTAFFISRLWCRNLCPLGAIYAFIAKFSLLRRVVGICINCRGCKDTCRMGAIKDDASYIKEECILCMDCIYNCPRHSTKFAWKKKRIYATQEVSRIL